MACPIVGGYGESHGALFGENSGLTLALALSLNSIKPKPWGMLCSEFFVVEAWYQKLVSPWGNRDVHRGYPWRIPCAHQ